MSSPSNAIQISRPQASEDERREKLQRLTPCKGKLSPAEVLNIPEGTRSSRFMAAKRALVEHANKILPPSQRGPR